MGFKEAFEAIKNGDFAAATPLLEKLARETGFASDVVNHAYSLALYRTGDNTRLADVAFRIGNALLATDPASAMDYFQRALLAGLDAPRVRRIGAVFEGWAGKAASSGLSQPVRGVAHVVGCVLPGHAPTQYVKMLSASLRHQGIESRIFTTEWASSWFFNPEGVPQSQNAHITGVETDVASVEGDFDERAARIAAAMRNAGVEVALYHASLSEQITARIAALRPAPVQINVNHGSEMDLGFFQGYVHLFRNGLERSRYRDHPSEWIPLASDIEERLRAVEPVSRASLGFEAAESISATFGNLYKVAGQAYLETLTEILHRFPRHCHVFAGAGDVKAIRRHLHAAGLLPRVRFMGHMGDVASLFDAVDIYFASFPHSGGHSILEAMGAGKPVVVLGYPPDSHYNSGAELVGLPELIAPNAAAYVEVADRLIRNPRLRTDVSAAMRERFCAEFRPSGMGVRFKRFIESITSP